MSQSKYPGKRICQVVKLRPEFEEEYIRIHVNVPEPVLEGLKAHHIEDYSIHYFKEQHLLISYFKYLGDDLEADARASRANPANREWWAVTDKMQETLVKSEGSHDPAGWWLPLEEVFRYEG